MPTYPIPHNAPSIPNPTPTSDPQFMGPKRNMYVDITGTVRSRPGASVTYTNFRGSSVQGIFQKFDGTNDMMLCTRNGTTINSGTTAYFDKIAVSDGPTSISLSDSLSLTSITLNAGTISRPFFFPYSVNTYIMGCPGGQSVMTYTNSDATEVSHSLGGGGFVAAWSGESILTAAYINNLIVATSRASTGFARDVARFSNVGDPLTWSANDFFTTEVKNDYITRVQAINGSILLFGPENIEVREFDGTSFPLVPNGVFNVGMLAPDGLAEFDDSLYFFDKNRRLMMIQGARQIIATPNPYATYLTDTLVPSASGGYFVQCDAVTYRGNRLLLICNRNGVDTPAIVYDIDKNDAYEWNWGTTSNIGLGFSTLVKNPTVLDGLIAGSGASAKVSILNEGAHTGFEGTETMRKGITTGWINHGTNRAKKSTEFRIYVERVDTSGTYPAITVRYKNNGSTSIAATRTITPSAATYQYACYRLKALGHYRERQYEIFTDTAAPLRIGKIEEDVTFL